LAAAGFAFLLLGMLIGYSGKKPAKVASGGAPRVSLDGPGASSTATTRVPALGIQPGAHVTTTTVTQSTAAAASASSACATPRTTLMPNTPGRGSGALPSFSTTGSWCIGWHFRCVLNPGGTGPFTISVVTGDATTGTPTLEQSGREAQGLTGETPTGTLHLVVATDPGCQWAIKVSGG
jgi:hypothetical protein